MPVNTSVDKILEAQQADPSKTLGLRVKDQPVNTGQYIARADAQKPPEISFAAAEDAKTYLVIVLDLDAPFTWWRGLGPILHWIQPGFKARADKSLTTDEAFIANYIGPAPPPGSAPHRYVFFLYTQPEGFEGAKFAPAGGKQYPTTSRMRSSLDDWEKKLGLGECLAVNYFTSN